MKKLFEIIKKYPEISITSACAIGIVTLVFVGLISGTEYEEPVKETIEVEHTVEAAESAFEETVEIVNTEPVTEEITEEVTEEVEPVTEEIETKAR